MKNFLQVLPGETACEFSKDLDNSKTARLLKTLTVKIETLCQEASGRSRDSMHSSKTSIVLYSCHCDVVQRKELTHSMAWIGEDRVLGPKGHIFCT